MNRSILFILLLLSSIGSYACGYYPYGEDLRMCFFKPAYYNYYWYTHFNYTPHTYYFENELDNTTHDSPNDIFWYGYCKGQVPMPEIKNALYNTAVGNINPLAPNAILQYLNSAKDAEAINYFDFAKECEPFNGWYGDPWERDTDILELSRKQLQDKAVSLSKSAKNKEFAKRYAFLAIRLAYYNGDAKTIRNLFETTFKNLEKKDIVYHWALYFYTLTEKDPAKAAYFAAQVFANAPDKRFAVYRYFDTKIALPQIIKYAQNNEEIANIYVVAAIKRHDRALDYIKKVYQLDPENEGLGFVMLREVNKLEDWIYTPQYTLFSPSIEDNYQSENEKVILSRVDDDRQYALEVLSFIKAAKPYDTFFVQVRAQLEFMTMQYANCLSTIKLLKNKLDEGLPSHGQLDMLQALALTASQPYGKAIIQDAVKPVLLKNKNDLKFIFALARELEFKGNTTDAVLLYMNMVDEYTDDNRKWSGMYWKDGRGLDHYEDYYTSWFTYIDINYTPEQLNALIKDITANTAEDDFSFWKYSWVKGKLSVLYDMLGTKYIRQNKLQEAHAAFSKTGSNYWDYNYGMWERPSFFNNGNQFDENPFYTLEHSVHFVPAENEMAINKYTVTKLLIHYLERAADSNEENRDYYYFLAANCYYNMTVYGNSWMMRRYYQGSYPLTGLEDEAEYEECNLAKAYYQKAYQTAKTDKFRALCLRMMAMCEYNRLSHISIKRHDYSHDTLNRYFRELKQKHPKYYDELVWDTCRSLNKYFNARR